MDQDLNSKLCWLYPRSQNSLLYQYTTIQLNYFNTELYSNLHHWQVDGKVATRYKDWKKPDIDRTPQDMLQSLLYFLSIILFIATIILNQGVWLTKIVQASSFLEFSPNPSSVFPQSPFSLQAILHTDNPPLLTPSHNYGVSKITLFHTHDFVSDPNINQNEVDSQSRLSNTPITHCIVSKQE